MSAAELPVYRELADLYQQQGQSQLRDRFLLLAAGAAHEAGNHSEADRLRLRLLQFNPHHMLKPYSSFADALGSADVQSYLRDLKQSYPLEVAHQMLATLRQSSLRQEAPIALAAEPEKGEDFGTVRLSPEQRPRLEPVEVHKAEPPPRLPPRHGAVPPPMRLPKGGPGRLPPRPGRPEPDHPAASAFGAWFATALFVLVLLLGAALAGYTVIRPFLDL